MIQIITTPNDSSMDYPMPYRGKDPLLARIIEEFDNSNRTVVVPYNSNFNFYEAISEASELIPNIEGLALIVDELKVGDWHWQKKHILNIGHLTSTTQSLFDSFVGDIFYRLPPGKSLIKGRKIEALNKSIGIENLGKLKFRSAYVVLGESSESLKYQTEALFDRTFGPRTENI